MDINTEFFKVVREFVPDLLGTFPEYKETVLEHYVDILEENFDTSNAHVVYEQAKSKLPKHFFDIMYKNNEIFNEPCEIIPHIDFSKIMNVHDITEKTQETIWKYLQLMLFSIVGDIKDQGDFGDTAKLFEAINEDEFKNTLENTINEMKDFFDVSNEDIDEADGSSNDTMPNPDDIHSHIHGMMNGKIGKLAQEIATETASELNLEDNLDGSADVNDVFKKLFRNPAKLMSIIKKVGSKIEDKMKSGDLNERELMEEAASMVDKMKTMPGMKNMKQMFSKMGLPSEMLGSLGGGSGKMNLGAMQGALRQNIKMSKQRERMLKKLEERKALMDKPQEAVPAPEVSDAELKEIKASLLSTAEPLQQSKRSAKPSNKKRKGGKNKKRK